MRAETIRQLGLAGFPASVAGIVALLAIQDAGSIPWVLMALLLVGSIVAVLVSDRVQVTEQKAREVESAARHLESLRRHLELQVDLAKVDRTLLLMEALHCLEYVAFVAKAVAEWVATDRRLPMRFSRAVPEPSEKNRYHRKLADLQKVLQDAAELADFLARRPTEIGSRFSTLAALSAHAGGLKEDARLHMQALMKDPELSDWLPEPSPPSGQAGE